MVLFLLKMADHTQAPEETVHSNDISAGNSAADGEDFSLTLNSSHEEEHPEVKDSTPYGCYFCLKVFASFLFATALLFALVANKVTIYAISHSLSNHSSGSGPNELTIDTIDQKISVFMLMVILIIPYGLAFLRCLWSSGVLQTLTRNLFCFCCCANFSCSRAKRDLETPWPSWGRIALIIVTSLLEVLGLWIILLYVFPFSTGLESVLSSALVFLGCNISDLLLWLKGRFFHDDQQIQEEPNARTKALTALFNTVPLFLSAIGLFLLLFFDKDIRHDGERGESSPIAWALPLGVALVAVSWVPTILQWQVTITPKKQLPISRIRFQLLAEDETGVSIFPDGCRWKAGLISNFLKVFFVPLVLLILGEIYIQNDAIINIALLIPPNEFATYVFHQEFFWYFLINICSSLLGYLFAWATIAISFGFTCRFCKSKRIFISALFCPLITASPLAAILIGVERTCSVMLPPEQCHSQDELSWGFIATVLILVASFVSCGVWIVTTRPRTILTSESQIFWHANYTGALLEQWLWLNRKTEKKDLTPVPTDKEKKNCVIYLCTTMCNESEEEMTQLLLSLKNVIDGRDRGSPLFHSHIWLDGAFDTKTKPESNTLSRNALQLLGIVKSVFDVSLGNEPPGTVSYRFETRKTRYGRRFTWTFYDLNEELEDVDLNVHLKDNRKVKKKKRWSQIMYLSYIIDFLCIKTAKRTGLDVDEILKDTFILTTDADVKFEFASVEALLDVFLRDETKQLGAVCARTHPLGSVANPLVSYQIFDYAIGHWLQKVANHTLGSLLCAPGCFSMYRTAILKNVLPEYGSDTSCGTEFLYKDMGEDRWLCTLMVNNGAWLEYCAAAEDKTFCPTGFEEFFKQRRRWIVSTMANMFLLMRSFGTVVRCNKHVTSLFMVYQFLLFISSLIGPATVILVIAGGYEYAYDINSVIITIILVILAAILLVVCYFAAHKTQILFAVGLSIILALAMVAGFIGTARQLVTDYNNITAFVYQVDKNDPWQVNVPISSIYITVVVGIFVITALLHPTEFLCLLHGITYLFFLPGGYLILMIYSICNITDQSWGTRESEKEQGKDGVLGNFFRDLKSFCCPVKVERSSAMEMENMDSEGDENLDIPFTRSRRRRRFQPPAGTFSADDWLRAQFYEKEIHACSPMFDALGYGDTSFIAGMSREEIRQVGLTNPKHINTVYREAQSLPPFSIDPRWPITETEKRIKWVNRVGLMDYKDSLLEKFDDLPSTTSKSKLRVKYGIHKPGYLKRLYTAIQQLRTPTGAEWVQMEVKEEVRKLVRAEASSSPNLDLESDDNMLGSSSSAVATSDHMEDRFWEQLVELRLKPQAVFPEREDRLAGELHDIRKTSLIWFAVANMFWLVLFLTLSNLPANDKKGSDLHVFGNNPVGLAFLFLFCLLLIIQFFSMLVHRVWTFIHLVARAKLPGSKTSRPDASVWNTRIARQQVVDPEEEEQFYQSWNATLKRVTEFSQSMSDQRSLLGYSIRK